MWALVTVSDSWSSQAPAGSSTYDLHEVLVAGYSVRAYPALRSAVLLARGGDFGGIILPLSAEEC